RSALALARWTLRRVRPTHARIGRIQRSAVLLAGLLVESPAVPPALPDRNGSHLFPAAGRLVRAMDLALWPNVFLLARHLHESGSNGLADAGLAALHRSVRISVDDREIVLAVASRHGRRPGARHPQTRLPIPAAHRLDRRGLRAVRHHQEPRAAVYAAGLSGLRDSVRYRSYATRAGALYSHHSA